MSRIGRQPVSIPAGVQVSNADGVVAIKGPKGELKLALRPEVAVATDDKEIRVEQLGDERNGAVRAYHGLTRALIQNMVTGVTAGYQKKLEINGVGYGAKVEGAAVVLTLGFSHPVSRPIPEGVTVTCPNQTTIVIEGCDKQSVGEVAASIRRLRPPEPYKGKGIKYSDETIKRKAGKAFGSA